MDPARFTRIDETAWRIELQGAMRVPAIIYADEQLIRDMDDQVYIQAANVATLPGIVQASYAMPDAHWGYGFPIGGVFPSAADSDRLCAAGKPFPSSHTAYWHNPQLYTAIGQAYPTKLPGNNEQSLEAS